MAGRIRIGEILLNAGIIDRDQLNAALGEQRRWGRPIGATLVKMGFLEERALVRALASQLALPVASLEGKRIAADVLTLVPRDIAERHMVLPLFVKEDARRTTLYLAMEDPGDLAVLDDLAFRTGLQVKPVMMAPSELCEGIDRYYRDVEAPASDAPTAPPDAAAAVAAPGRPGASAPATQSAPPSPAPASPTSEPIASGAGASAASSAEAGDVASGTEELVRHFKRDADPAAASAASAPSVASAAQPAPGAPSAPADSRAAEVAPPAAATATAPAEQEAAHPSFDETALAAPPPREPSAGGTEAPRHPPVESLAGYEAKTRTILHVLTQLLIEKGVISRQEFHARVAALSSVGDRGGQD